jgi:hypothetical protein
MNGHFDWILTAWSRLVLADEHMKAQTDDHFGYRNSTRLSFSRI